MALADQPVDGGEPRTARPGEDTLSVTQLCARIDDAVSGAFPDEVWVQGAISGLTRSGNGHVYFDLVDQTGEIGATTGATLPVALFASTRQLVNRILRKAGGVRMHDGIEIRIRGRVAYYPPQGRVQLIMSLIDPQFTLGQQAEARTALLEKLSADGLLDRNSELALPALPLRVALVTSEGSAACADFVDELFASGHPFRVTLLDSRVQGPEAVPSLADAIGATARLDVDAVVVTRGGGARGDLVAFDHERVATAVARCPHPVIVGVGHEIDRSVTDEVAHTSAKTPTACAGVLVAAVDAFVGRLDTATGRLGALAGLHLSSAQDRLAADGARLIRSAGRTVDRSRLELTHAGHRLTRAPALAEERQESRLAMASTRLAAVDPAVALRRGWTITRTADGRLVRSVDDVSDGSELRTTTMDGMIASRVEGPGSEERS
ncbi:MAG: exodeoxyribonuclease VII large subunit [Actinomycetota bacterium]